MAKKVFQLSFKDNERELNLYEAVINSYNKSAFVKECIEFYILNKDKKLNIEEDHKVTYPETYENIESDIDDIEWDFD